MNVPDSYSGNLSLNEKVLYVLSLLSKATADEIAMEIMELQGTAAEEGVAELNIETIEALNHLHQQGLVKMETQSNKQIYYWVKK